MQVFFACILNYYTLSLTERGEIMLLGIDVGGTFTDAVLVDNGAVRAQAKRPTTHGEVLRGILAALDAVMDGADAEAFFASLPFPPTGAAPLLPMRLRKAKRSRCFWQ